MTKRNNREKFIKLAEKRVIKSIKDIRLIGNLANRNYYEYTDEDVKKIIKVLENEMKILKDRFSSSGKEDDIIFKL